MYACAKYCLICAVALATSMPGSEWQVSARVAAKKWAGGRVLTYTAELFQHRDGQAVAHYNAPLNMYILTSRNGRVQVYSPTDSSVRTIDDPAMGSRNSMLYCLLHNRFGDLALRDLGWRTDSSWVLEGHQLTRWRPSGDGKRAVGSVTLAHTEGRIVYAAYYGPKGYLMRKTYYSGHIELRRRRLPTVVTDISYTSPAATDSIIEKLRYEDFRFDAEADSTLGSFQIPAYAVGR